MNTFLIIDASHLYYRARYSVRGTSNEKLGMMLHILLNSLNKAWRVHHATHVVFAFDGKSWRHSVYPPYKQNRRDKRALQTASEQIEDKLFFEAFDIFREYIKTKTNCTVLEESTLEADDLIAGFLQSHPNDFHIIVSSDKDFEQLLASNVVLYNGVDDQLTTLNGIFDYKGSSVTDKKTGLPKPPPNPEWSVFEKAMRGCTTDNIFSACPGVRTKSSKKKIGLEGAYNDRIKKGFAWNSLMMQHWTDHNGIEHRVLDDYNRNVGLVNLTAQPEPIRKIILETIKTASIPKKATQVGLYFLKFCGKYELNKMAEQATNISHMLNAPYPKNE